MLKTKNTADHSTEYDSSILNIINVFTLANWDVNPEYELWFEVSVIDSVERNGNTFVMLKMHTY